MKTASNRAERKYLRQQRTKKVVRGFLVSSGTIIFILVAAGVIYTWYMGQNVDQSSIAEIETNTNTRQEIKHTKPGENVPVGASIQSFTTPIVPGSNASIDVRTKSEAICTISVKYNEIASNDSGLIDKTADEYGTVSWSWTVESTAPLGTWPVTVTCAQGESSGVVVGNLEVVSEIK